jgi:hypothetical protein
VLVGGIVLLGSSLFSCVRFGGHPLQDTESPDQAQHAKFLDRSPASIDFAQGKQDKSVAISDGRTLDQSISARDKTLPSPDKAHPAMDKAKSPDEAALKPDTGCVAASSSCWDVSGVFSKTDFNYYPVMIFNQTVGDNQKIYALLDGSQDDSYSAPGYICSGYYTEPQPKPQAWFIERKFVSSTSYRLLVRGQSAPDCSLGQPTSAGEVQINMARGWSITQNVSCVVAADNASSNGVAISTWCTVDMAKGIVSWQAGSLCGGCCSCPDGAYVSIEVRIDKT